jgi:hypothetical protein
VRFNEAPPVTGKLSHLLWVFKRRNNILYWLSTPLWVPVLMVAAFAALGLARLGYQAEKFLGWIGVDAWDMK